MSATSTCAPCTRTSDNKHWDCPPHMADGRLFTDYRPRCDINLQYKRHPMTGSFDYRQYLITHGNALISEQRQQAFRGAYAGPCVQPYDQGTVVADKDAFVCNQVTCQVVSKDPSGLGTGRDYGMLPQQRQALSKFLDEQEHAQQQLRKGGTVNCCADPLQSSYYPLPGLNMSDPQQGAARWAVPSGAQPLKDGGDPRVL